MEETQQYQQQHHCDHDHHHHHRRIGHKHGEGFSIDYFAYTSRIRHWNPGYKVVLSVLTLLLCIVLNNPYVSVAVILAMAYLTMVKGGLPLREYLPILTVQLGFIILGTIAIAVDFSSQPLGQYNLDLGFCYVFTSRPRLLEMAFLMLKVFAAVSALQMLIVSTLSTEIISVLRKAHAPKIFIELMNMIYRYIFILMDVYTKMRNSAEARRGYCDFRTSCYTFGGIAGNMLLISLKKANSYFDAMEARCYDGDLLFLEEDKQVTTSQIAAAGAFIIFLILLWAFTR
jgi:cobalt/nickel transport system permease protein